jgi:hypothetical protein
MKTITDVELALLKTWLYFGECEYGIFNENKGSLIRYSQKEITRRKLQQCNREGKHIFVRPTLVREPFYLLIDDINKSALKRDHTRDELWKPGRLVIETSPNNLQVWIRSTRPLDLDEKSFWLEKFDSDPGAQPKRRWGRCPGFYNVKRKHMTESGYPWVRIMWAEHSDSAEFPSLDRSAFSQRELQHKKLCQSDQPVPGWIRKLDPICRETYEKTSDQSRTDFSYILAMLVRGYPEHEIEKRILTERKEWENHQNSQFSYIQRSIRKAHEFLSRNQNK